MIDWIRQAVRGFICAIAVSVLTATSAQAGPIVIAHDVNTLGTAVAGVNEATFAVNVANFITAGEPKTLLLFESTHGDPTRNFAANVLTALSTAGFTVTVTSNFATPLTGFSGVFVGEAFPSITFVNNNSLISYVDGGGGVYLAGGVGNTASVEAAGWSTFLNHYGLAFATSYNGINNVPITSANPIFAGVTSLKSGNGQSIINLGTNPNAQIVQSLGAQGVYAIVTPVPEPASLALLGIGGLGLLGVMRTRNRRGSKA